MKESKKIKIAMIFFAIVAIFGNSAIELLGEARCFAIANLIGEYIFAPIMTIGAIIFISYLFWYFFWNVPKKIVCLLIKK